MYNYLKKLRVTYNANFVTIKVKPKGKEHILLLPLHPFCRGTEEGNKKIKHT